MSYDQKLHNKRINISTIVGRLPLHRFLDDSRSKLLRLQPTWITWYKQHLPQLNEGAAQLARIESGVVTINADNSATAALIKHQQQSLLDALQSQTKHLAGKATIKRIKVRIDLESTSAALEMHEAANLKPSREVPLHKPTDDAIHAVETLQSSIKDPGLAESLGKLAETLKHYKEE